jgi:glycosyltransferase involved in cell wall biosynthesis
MEDSILKNICLCAIVRDEIMNPAGGIARFIDSHVPYFERAVIADTGSVDGTKEILEEMQPKYPNLIVKHIPFRNYSSARERSLKFAKTEYVFVLDADELLTHEKPQNDFQNLKNVIENNPSLLYNLNFLSIYPDGSTEINKNCLNSRLFENSGRFIFRGMVYEQLNSLLDTIPFEVPDIYIKHFLPEKSALSLKDKNWYDRFSYRKAPSTKEGFKEWKKFNPHRNDYI